MEVPIGLVNLWQKSWKSCRSEFHDYTKNYLLPFIVRFPSCPLWLRSPPYVLRTKLHGKTYEFPDIRLLMGKANEEKSGDHLAGVGAETAAERVAAKLILAEVPLWVLRGESGCAV